MLTIEIDDMIDRFDGSIGYATNSKEICQYIADLLKELKERRKQPEIIRCGECAHSNKEYSGEMWCGICNGFGIDENSFCSFAEKRYVENG